MLDYPASICPLTKRKRDNPAVAERFELFIQGMEIANAYTELNDPDLQEQLFQTQLAGQAEEDSMAKMDHDFIRALRHGMPPAGGLGIGIDRLVMLLTNTPIDPRRDPVPAAAADEAVSWFSDCSFTTPDTNSAQGRPMYKLLLCWRYLRTRYIALASIISVMLGVATMIVVNSVMAGFTHEMQDRIHGILSDLVFESHGLDGFPDADRHMAADSPRRRRLHRRHVAHRARARHAQLTSSAGSQFDAADHCSSASTRTTYATVSDFGQVPAAPGEPQAARRFNLHEGGYDVHRPPGRRQRGAAPRHAARRLGVPPAGRAVARARRSSGFGRRSR